MRNGWRRITLAGAVAASLAAGPAAATCTRTAPSIQPLIGDASTAERFRILSLRSTFGQPVSKEEWRSLLVAMRADPATPTAQLASVMARLANLLDGAPEMTEALQIAQEAETLTATDSDRFPERWMILTNLSYAKTNKGMPGPGLSHAQAAMALAEARFGAESWERATAATAAGWATYAVGDYEGFARYSGLANDLAKRCLPTTDPRIATAMSNHAIGLIYTGRVEESVAVRFASVEWGMANLSETRPDEAATLALLFDGLATNLLNTGRYAEAEVVFRRALDLESRLDSDSLKLRANTLGKFGSTLGRIGRTDAAEALWLQSYTLFGKIAGDQGNPVEAASPMRRAANVALARGEVTLALKRRRLALTSMQSAAADHPERAAAELELADTLLQAGDLAEAARVARGAILAIRAKLTESDQRRIAGEMIHAVVLAKTEGAEAGYQLALPIARRLESKVLDTASSRGDLISYAPVLGYASAAFVALALEAGHDEDAFRALQLTNLSTLALASHDRATALARRDPGQAALVATLQEAVRVRRVRERARSAALGRGDKVAVAAVATEIAALDATISRASADLDRLFPEFRAEARPAPVSLADFRARLQPGEVLVAPITLELERGTITVTVTRDGLSWSRSEVPAGTVASLVERLRASVEAGPERAFDLAASQALYATLIPPALRPVLRRNASLLYYATGPLATVPPALLSAGRRGRMQTWLIDTHNVRVMPTLAQAPAKPLAPRRRFLGVGAPHLPTFTVSRGAGFAVRGGTIEGGALIDLPPLPLAVAELERMRRALGGLDDVVLTGADATEAAVEQQPLERFGTIAFATHGLRAGEVSGLGEPALVLTPEPGEKVGLLTASEIAALRLDADWVILSACNSAAGGEQGAPAYSGLATAFVLAGARSLLVSHWPIRDDAAARITVDTLKATRTGRHRAAALRDAMLALRRDRSVPAHDHPSIWAPFVLVER
ncbi:CHAT domain-containing protein [Sphingomonas sp. NBWT7]|uniref:CHAT domain-containing protein n=1 Tax=Sphingomonas sp. NBWT7 TaxID=2596913 RepID=UPI0016253807|nr:CHAT domain-containing protein [Sphingomonas sp. NBWT7]QNE32990.1 CHAT domain-containing protein [Sphingomonas sp. NBWT7]